MTSIFLSYARGDDEPFVRRLYDDLTARGFDVWFDRVSMPSRMLTFHQEIRDAITARDLLLLVVGPKAATSDYVTQEWQYAYLVANKRVNPIVRLDGVKPDGSRRDGYDLIPEDLKLLHAEDFRYDDRYAEHLENLVRQLNEPAAPVGKLVAVPELPPGYRAQPERLRALRDLLLIDLQKPVVVSGAAARVGLQGMGGIGKSVLASAMAHHPEVRRAFPDGIYWVRLGQHPRVEELQRGLAKNLGGDGLFDSVAAGKEQLRGLLAEKAVLLILDDAWDRPSADAFNVAGPRSKILLTTRDAGLVTELAARENHYRVDLPTVAEAFAILAGAAQVAPDDLPAEANAVIDECGRLPLALALCGGIVQGGVSWHSVLEALRDHDLEFLSADHPDPQNEQHQNAWKAMDASVRVLPPEEQERFAELAVFAADTGAPLAAVATLWQHTGGLKPRQSEALLAKFVARSLVQRSAAGDAATARYTLHDLLRHFASGIADRRFGSIAALHHRLLEAYATVSPDGWVSGPDDGYFLQHLCEHLVAAGKDDEAIDLLLDAAWIERSVAAGLIYGLIEAYDLALTRREGSLDDGAGALRLVQGALRLSQHVLVPHPEELPSQLHGRLLDSGNQAVDRVLEGFRLQTHCPWLRPLTPSLTAPRGPLVRTLIGHTSGVTAVAVTPDGKTIVSGSWDKTLKVWDLKSGRELRNLAGHTSDITAIAVTSDARTIISGSRDETLKIWDLDTSRELRTLDGHTSWIDAVAVTSDGKILVSIAWDGTVKIWDLETGRELHTLIGKAPYGSSVAVTPDGRTIISRPLGNSVKIWDLESGQELRTLDGHSDAVTAVAITPDGKIIVSRSSNGIVKVWDLESGQELRTLYGHSDGVRAVAVTPYGQTIISRPLGHSVKIWDLESGQELRTLDGHSDVVTAVAITPDGRIIVSGSLDNTVKVWDLKRDHNSHTHPGHISSVLALAIIPDVRIIISGSRDRTVKVWDPESGRELRTLYGHSDGIWAVAVTPDGQTIISGSRDQTVKIWDLERGRELHTLLGHTSLVKAVAVTPDGRTIVSGSEDRTVKVWDLESGQERRTLAGHIGVVTAVAITPDGRSIVSGSADKTVKVWDLESGQERHTLSGHTSMAYTLAITPDGRTIVSGSEDGTVKVWDLDSGRELRTLYGHSDGVSAVAITLDGRTIVSGSRDGTVKVWDLESGRGRHTLAHGIDGIVAVANTSGELSRTISVGSVDSPVDGILKVKIPFRDAKSHTYAFERWITEVAVTPDGRAIISGSRDGTLKVWDLESGALITQFSAEGGVIARDACGSQLTIVVGDSSGSVHILKLENEPATPPPSPKG